ncbi:MAG: hypothetical protein WCC53_11135 [Thermoanaerobaculia bacterium]|jgi:hypothetical protein
MRASRRAIPFVLAVLAASCGRPAGQEMAPAVPPAPAPIRTLAGGLPLAPGLVLTLVPNLPGVDGEDMSDLARRQVEVLEAQKGGLRLKWTGQVRVEKPESARRREDWVRARSNAPRGGTPEPTVPAVYETHEVGGTLFFPDFSTASEFLLPGLWPEGTATIRSTTTLWISPNALAELKGGGRASVPLAVSGPLLREPAVTILRRAIDLAGKAPSGRPGLWTAGPPAAFTLRVDGNDVTVPALEAHDWFGTYKVHDASAAPLVLAALPQPPSSPPADLFAPASVLRSLLGYRVAEVTRPKESK